MVTSNGGPKVSKMASLQSLERRVNDIQQTLRRLRTEDPGQQFAGPEKKYNASTQGRNTAPARSARPPTRCFHCGDPNHIRRFCPGRRVTTERRQCFACGDIGHLCRDCPHVNSQGVRPFCIRCRSDSHWMIHCNRSPIATGGPPACAVTEQVQGSEN